MPRITEKMQEELGVADAIIAKTFEKESHYFYTHPTGFSLYRYDGDIDKEIPLFSAQGTPSWHFTSDIGDEDHEKVEPSGAFWDSIHSISKAIFGEEEEREEAQQNLEEIDQHLAYHEKYIVRSVWSSFNKYGEDFLKQEEIIKLLFAGEIEV